MGVRSQSESFNEVRRRELDAIVDRRRQVKLLPERERPEDREEVAQRVVGLALSGGGIRSASFNTGLLQGLYRSKLLRYIDYLATVSGGSYAGTCLSSTVMQSDARLYEEESTEADKPSRSADSGTRGPVLPLRDRFPLAQETDGRQPPRVLELINGGHYLGRPLLFLNRCLIGAVLVGVVAISGVLAASSLAALLFRVLDGPWVGEALWVLGFRGDVMRAFFPFCVCGVAWTVAWMIAYWRSGQRASGAVAQGLLILTIVTFLMAVAALLGTGDIDISFLKVVFGTGPPRGEINTASETIRVVLLALLGASLLPYLRPKELLRSGMRPRNVWERRIFLVASYGLLAGLPLLLFAAMAQEDISNHNALRETPFNGIPVCRRYDLHPKDFQDNPGWAAAWRVIKLRAKADKPGDPLSKTLWEIARETQPPSAEKQPPDEVLRMRGHPVDQTLIYHEHGLALDRSLPIARRWLLLIGHAVGAARRSELSDQLDDRWKFRKLSERICTHVNEKLFRSPEFFTYVLGGPKAYDDLDDKAVEEGLDGLRALFPDFTEDEWKTRKSRFRELFRRGDMLRTLAGSNNGRLDKLLKKPETEETAWIQALTADPTGLPNWLIQQVGALNWEILRTWYGDLLVDKSVVFAHVVQPHDQKTRGRWFLWSLAVFLVAGFLVDLNATSLHAFYRNQLAKTWITGRDHPLRRTETTNKGAPYHLLCGTLNQPGHGSTRATPPADVFTFGQRHCGSLRTGYMRTEDFLLGRYELADAMAVSGAALTPLYPTNPLLALLMLLTNMRLGQWLPNPAFRLRLPRPLQWVIDHFPASPLRLLIGSVQPPENRYYCFVSDGGHIENLGLEQLLLRRCRLVIVSDASSDPNHAFNLFMEVVRRVRSAQGIRIHGVGADDDALGLERLIPKRADRLTSGQETQTFSEKHFILARIEYPEDSRPELRASRVETPTGTADNGRDDGVESDQVRSALMIYIKPTFTSDEPTDLMRYWAGHPEFPHDPTSDQFYDPDKFESYRQLGFHIGEHLCVELGRLKGEHPILDEILSRWPPAMQPRPSVPTRRRRPSGSRPALEGCKSQESTGPKFPS